MSTDSQDVSKKICSYLSVKLPEARDIRIENLEKMDVGWSHETFLFDASFKEAGQQKNIPLCLRRDPGNALLRHFSDLSVQFKVLKCLENTSLQSPKPYWYEEDHSILDSPFGIFTSATNLACEIPCSPKFVHSTFAGLIGRLFFGECAGRSNGLGAISKSSSSSASTHSTTPPETRSENVISPELSPSRCIFVIWRLPWSMIKSGRSIRPLSVLM